MADEYDVIVIGAHGQHQRTQPGLGPVASRVVARAPGVVLIGRETLADNNFRILAGIDGSESARNALENLACSFDIEDSEITLMHVIEMPGLHPGLGEDRFQAQTGCEAQREAREILCAACAELGGYPFLVRTLIEEGCPAWQLLSQTEVGDYDLVVVGATGAGEPPHMMGNVSVELAWNAPCSVAVVR